MVSHALKMLVTFIFVIAIVNLLYYETNLSHDPPNRRFKPLKRYGMTRYSGKKKKHVLKVVWLPGPRPNIKVKKSMIALWKPQYSCSESSTKIETTIPTEATDYRDPEDSTDITLCPPVPPSLGPTDWRDALDTMVVERVFSMLKDGGSYTPFDCLPRHYVAVIVPFKGANGQLILSLLSLHLALLQQQIEYQIFVVKQSDESRPFYIGKLLNIGFLEAQAARQDINWTCIVFHNPDLAPRDSRNLYQCSEHPKQLVARVNNTSYANKFGGAVAIRPEDFRAINGFSNMYYDHEYVYLDMYDRLIAANYTIENPSKYAVYDDLRRILEEEKDSTMITTSSTNTVAPIIELTSTPKDWQNDGLASVSQSYAINTRLKMSHVLLTVDLSPQPISPGRLRAVVLGIPDNPSTSSTLNTEFATAANDDIVKTSASQPKRDV